MAEIEGFNDLRLLFPDDKTRFQTEEEGVSLTISGDKVGALRIKLLLMYQFGMSIENIALKTALDNQGNIIWKLFIAREPYARLMHELVKNKERLTEYERKKLSDEKALNLQKYNLNLNYNHTLYQLLLGCIALDASKRYQEALQEKALDVRQARREASQQSIRFLQQAVLQTVKAYEPTLKAFSNAQSLQSDLDQIVIDLSALGQSFQGITQKRQNLNRKIETTQNNLKKLSEESNNLHLESNKLNTKLDSKQKRTDELEAALLKQKAIKKGKKQEMNVCLEKMKKREASLKKHHEVHQALEKEQVHYHEKTASQNLELEKISQKITMIESLIENNNFDDLEKIAALDPVLAENLQKTSDQETKLNLLRETHEQYLTEYTEVEELIHLENLSLMGAAMEGEGVADKIDKKKQKQTLDAEKKAALETQTLALKEEIHSLKGSIANAEKGIASIHERRVEIEELKASVDKKHYEANLRLTALEAEDELAERLETLDKQEMDLLQYIFEEKTTEIELCEKSAQLSFEIEKQQTDKNTLEQKLSKLQTNIADKKEALAKAKQAVLQTTEKQNGIQKLERAIESMQKNQEHLQEQMDLLTENLNEKKDQLEQTTKEKRFAQIMIEEFTNKMKPIQDEKKAVQTNLQEATNKRKLTARYASSFQEEHKAESKTHLKEALAENKETPIDSPSNPKKSKRGKRFAYTLFRERHQNKETPFQEPTKTKPTTKKPPNKKTKM